MNQRTTSSQDSSQDWTFKTEEEIAAEQERIAGTSTATDLLVFREKDPSEVLVNLTPDLTMTFYEHGKEVGSMSWKTGKMEFSGEADPSAKALLEAVKFYIDSYISGRVHEAQATMAEYLEHFK